MARDEAIKKCIEMAKICLQEESSTRELEEFANEHDIALFFDDDCIGIEDEVISYTNAMEMTFDLEYFKEAYGV